MMTARRLLILTVLTLPPCQAIAQALPWPTNPPRAATPTPRPSNPPRADTPAPWSFGGEGGTPPCKAEFAKLREDLQKLGLAAKAAGQRKVSREEMCKHVTAYSEAELKWVEFTEANVTSCGIPAEVLSQLKHVHSNSEQTKEKICAAGPGATPAVDAPRLPSSNLVD